MLWSVTDTVTIHPAVGERMGQLQESGTILMELSLKEVVPFKVSVGSTEQEVTMFCSLFLYNYSNCFSGFAVNFKSNIFKKFT